MTPRERAQVFLNSPEKMEKYGQAVTLLREIGFEEIMRALGEPQVNFPLAHPQLTQMLAYETSERKGWYAAIDHFFFFDDALIAVTGSSTSKVDFGSVQKLKDLGFTTEEIAGALNAKD